MSAELPREARSIGLLAHKGGDHRHESIALLSEHSPHGRANGMKVACVWGLAGLLEVPVATDIAVKVRDSLVFHLGVEEARLTDDARLVEDLGADSLDLVEIATSCEEKFDIDIPTEAVRLFKTVGDTIRFIEARTATTVHLLPDREPPARS